MNQQLLFKVFIAWTLAPVVFVLEQLLCRGLGVAVPPTHPEKGGWA